MKIHIFFYLLFLLFATIATNAFATIETNYCNNQKLKLAMPEGEGPFPGIIFIHGGGWVSGNLEDFSDEIKEAARHGYVAITINYRLTREEDKKYPWPAQINDVKCAVRWFRAHAREYKLDPEKIGVIGHSAGAHLAMMLGFTKGIEKFEGNGGYEDYSSEVNAVVSVAGPSELKALYQQTTYATPVIRLCVNQLLEGPPTLKPDNYVDASPLTYVENNEFPIMVIQGKLDQIATPEQSKILIGELDRLGHDYRLLEYDYAGHELKNDWPHLMGELFKFFDKHLKHLEMEPFSCSPYPSCEW